MPQNSLANPNYTPRAPLNYIGSKHSLLPFIDQTLREVVGEVSQLRFADIFAGTGAVAKYFKGRVRQVMVNDLEAYSYTLNRHYIGNHAPLDGLPLVAELNDLAGVEGLIYENYCMGGGQERQYFSDENGKKIDAMRQKIEAWYQAKTINSNEYYFLLASLLESADKVANVASVYGAFLKQLKKTAQKSLILQPAHFQVTPNGHEVYQMDANQLIQQISGDILYLDPPYNHRQYGANYHMLNTIALYDEFAPKGKTGLREYERSAYCVAGKVAEAFEALIAQAKFNTILLSYNNEGLMSVEQVAEIMSKYGDYTLKTMAYRRFKADTDSNRNHKASDTEEYLHVLVK